MRIRLCLIAVLALAALSIAGCGGSTRTVTRTVTTTTSAPLTAATPAPAPSPTGACPPRQSTPGCSIAVAPTEAPGLLKLAPIGGAEWPDVSDWQGPITPNGRTAGVNWGLVKAWQLSHGWPAFGAFKLGEYGLDPDASINSAALTRLGMGKLAYWFVRNTGCSHEAAQIIADAKLVGVHAIALDAEVGEAAGYTTCLIPSLRASGWFHLVVVYTGPGTWPGGVTFGAPLWDAAYNFSGPQFGGLWTSHAAAWQFTDGVFAARTFVPGVGFDDVNLDTGMTKLADGPPAGPSDTQMAKWKRARNSSQRVFAGRNCVRHLARHDCFAIFGHRVRYYEAKLNAGTNTGWKRPHCYGPRRNLHSPFCRVIRPYVRRWAHLRDASTGVRRRHYATLVKQNLY